LTPGTRLVYAPGQGDQPSGFDRGFTALDAIPPEHRDTILAPEIRRVPGDLLLCRNDRDEGERQLREAIDMARGRSERILEFRATTRLARLWRQQGRREEARRVLLEIWREEERR